VCNAGKVCNAARVFGAFVTGSNLGQSWRRVPIV
jgi:hypothetical protein